MSMENDESFALATHETVLKRFKRLRNVRPGVLASFIQRLAGPEERRRIVRTANGLRVYLDPLSHLGTTTLTDGCYEAETEQIFRNNLRLGDTFLDVGANEGYFSALCGTLVGEKGLVIAVEPQSRLRDVIEINLRINDVSRFAIYRNALGGEDGTTGVINLWPSFNTGASSVVVRYRFSRATESFSFVTLDRIMREQGLTSIDLAKVDVEGFEDEVVDALATHLRNGVVRKLLLDFHRPALVARGIQAEAIHVKVLAAGYKVIQGDSKSLHGYVLYEHRASSVTWS